MRGIAISLEGLGSNSRAGQIRQSVANAAIFFRNCVAQSLSREMGPAIRCTLRHTTRRIIDAHALLNIETRYNIR